MIPEQFAYLAILFSSIGISFYVRDILRGTTKPNIVSWFLWFLAPVVGGFLQLQAHAGLSVIPVFVAGFVCVPVIVTALCKQNALWQITTLDVVCGALSVCALALWILTREVPVAILLAILSDLLAAVPTLRKAWTNPESETTLGYVPGVINNTIGLLTIRNWIFSIYSFGIYLIALNLILTIFTLRKKLFI